jgi:hypothetical protein
VIISNYTSNNTEAANGRGGSLFISLSYDEAAEASITDGSITNSSAINSASDNGGYGGGGIYISGGSALLSGVNFNYVQALGNATFTEGGAVAFTMTHLTMENCSIENAVSEKVGGAVAGVGPSPCIFNGVSFTSCTAPQGSILYGNSYAINGGGPAYTVGPGCSVEGAAITSANYAALSSRVYLVNGASLTVTAP